MANIGSFDATQHDPTQSYDPIPAGKYRAMVVDSEVKPTKAGTGHLLKLTWEVLEGEYKGRKVFDNVNIDNPNPQAVEIAQKQLSAICRACGRLQISDSAEIHDIPCVIKVAVRPASGDYDAQNTIKAVEPVGAASAAAHAAPAAASAPVGQKKAPWAA